MTQINQVQKSIRDVSVDLQERKKTEIESKAPGINVLATTVAMIAVQNEILDVSNLVKKKNRL